MLMHTRKGTTIVTQQEKVTNETRQQMNNLFQRLCSVRSFLLSRKHHYLFATGSFHFRTGQAKLSQAHFYSIQSFSNSSTLPWKNWQQTASWSFSWSFSPTTIDFQNSPSSDFYMAWDLSLLRRPPSSLHAQKSLPHLLRNSLNSIPRGFQWFFRGFVIF